MEAMRQSWSDDRLDALNQRVGEGFARVDERFARVENRIERLDEKIDTRTAELHQAMQMGFQEINARFDRMQQTMIRVGGGLIGVLVASGAGLIATQL